MSIGAAYGAPEEPTQPTTAGPVEAPPGTGREAPGRPSAIPPRARQFQGKRAGLVSRLLANTVDFAVVSLTLAGGYAALVALRFLWNSRTFSFPVAPFGLLLLLGGVVTVAYLTGCWVTTGRSYGDHLFGLRVVGPRGSSPRIGVAFVRALVCTLFPIGLFWVALSRENRSAQDVVLRTSVVYDWTEASA